jgi:CBS domain-containing protein
MFSIYGESGRIFRGPMEDLWRVEALRRVLRARRVQDRALDGASFEPETHAAPTAAGAVTRHPGAERALTAYARASGSEPQRHPLSRVADVMSRRVHTVAPEMTVLHAWRQLTERGVGQAPVLDARGALVGLLTRADLLDLDHLPQPDASPLVWRALLMEPVAAVMLSPVPAVAEDTELRRVARVLLDAHLPGLPVVAEDERLIGFISRSDILRAVVHDPPLDLWS